MISNSSKLQRYLHRLIQPGLFSTSDGQHASAEHDALVEHGVRARGGQPVPDDVEPVGGAALAVRGGGGCRRRPLAADGGSCHRDGDVCDDVDSGRSDCFGHLQSAGPATESLEVHWSEAYSRDWKRQSALI